MSPVQGGSELRHSRDGRSVRLVCVDQMWILPGSEMYSVGVAGERFLGFEWPVAERRRWLEFQASQARAVSGQQEGDGMELDEVSYIKAELPYVSSQG
jgi:hypothetical protein